MLKTSPRLRLITIGSIALSVAWGCEPDSTEAVGANNGTSGSGGGSTGGSGGSGQVAPPEQYFDPGSLVETVELGCDDVVELLFVIDKSGSMNCNLPAITPSATCESDPVQVDLNKPRKWDVVTGEIKAALTTMHAEYEPEALRVGVRYFNTDNICGTQAESDITRWDLTDDHLTQMSAALDLVVPFGGTPIVGAAATAYQELITTESKRRYVILVTDGTDSCQSHYAETQNKSEDYDFDTELLNLAASAVADHNIRTFVLGAPGSEGNIMNLSKLAQAGGNTECDAAGGEICHFDMTTGDFVSGLTEALTVIQSEIGSCLIN
ncbi:MAG: VWA domain-containing protein [Polyangiaceae bacterium]|nr:VWA domain-containing protein [Polyangiaceae bacterium]